MVEEGALAVDLGALGFIGSPDGQEDLGGDGFANGGARQQLRDHHRPQASVEIGDGDMRKDRPDAVQHVLGRPIGLSDAVEIEQVGAGRLNALVRAPGIVKRLVEHLFAEGVLVQHRQVIKIQIAVVGDLPVRAWDDLTGMEVPVLKAIVRQQLVIAAEESIEAQRAVRVYDHPDQAGPLGHRQRGQAVAGLVDLAEVLGRGDAHQLALLGERPAMIRAHEALGVAAPFGGDVGAPVAAGIDEGADHAVLAARDQHRHARRLEGFEVPRLRHLGRRRQQQRHALEDLLDLRLEDRRVEITGGGKGDHLRNLFQGVGPGVRHAIADHGGEF